MSSWSKTLYFLPTSIYSFKVEIFNFWKRKKNVLLSPVSIQTWNIVLASKGQSAAVTIIWKLANRNKITCIPCPQKGGKFYPILLHKFITHRTGKIYLLFPDSLYMFLSPSFWYFLKAMEIEMHLWHKRCEVTLTSIDWTLHSHAIMVMIEARVATIADCSHAL